MQANSDYHLEGLAKTLLIPLYIRAEESRRPDPLINDERAVALVRQLGPTPSWFRDMRVDKEDKVALVLRNREVDRAVRAFLASNRGAVVVHIGCGLDSRFERVDDGRAEWYDLDLPEVIELRRKLIGGEAARYHLLACSALDREWLDRVGVHRSRPFLFVAEGVLIYFEEEQVKSLVIALRDQFPGADLVFDAFSPFLVWGNNRRYARTKIGARCRWGLKRGRDLEGWAKGISLLDEWFPFDQPEPRLSHVRWVRFIPLLSKVMGVYHYRLGSSAG